MDVKGLRVERGLSQGDLAEGCGVSQSLVAKWEAGREPNRAQVVLLSEILGITPKPPVRNQYPSAPLDAEARKRWFKERSRAFVEGRVRFSPSGTEGCGVANG
jgi:transcriptional regulator with XRE-family HTH domain